MFRETPNRLNALCAAHRRNGQARGSPTGRKPRPAIRASAVMKRQGRGGQMQKSRGRVRVSPTIVERSDFALGTKVQYPLVGRYFSVSVDYSVDPIAVTLSIFETLDHQCDCGISGNLASRSRRQTLASGRDMNRLARHVYRSDQRGIEFVLAQSTQRNP